MFKYIIVLLFALLAITFASPISNQDTRFERSVRVERSPHHRSDCDGPTGGFGGFGPSVGAGAEAEAEAGAGSFGGMTPFGGSNTGAQASANAGSQAFGK